ncbi:uncharacterized protein [Oscarella lobularis]|uniref:uncharacterized protein n=1 Tax=Oscarella lobularis TaxID=121494 RepID=UPI0033135573
MSEQIIPYDELTFPADDNDALLGAGSYGRVRVAVWRGARVAAKELHGIFFETGGSAQWEAAFVARFRDEMRVHASFRHPNVVQYFGVAFRPDTNRPVLVAELMRESLQARLDRSSLGVVEMTTIARDVACALSYIHDLGVAHRDLAPKNILLDYRHGHDEGVATVTAKLADMGVAKNMDVAKRLTWRPGTEHYMPPEALFDCEGCEQYTLTIDVFSLGVVMLQMIVCRDPSPSPIMRRRSLAAQEYVVDVVPEVERRASDVESMPDDHPLREWVLLCLEAPAKRPSSERLADALNALLNELGSVVEPSIEKQLRREKEELQTHVNGYKEECEKLRADVVALKEANAAALDRVDALTRDVTSATEKVAKLEADLAISKTASTRHKNKAVQYEAKFRKAEAARAELERTVARMNDELQMSRWSEIVLTLEKETALADVRLKHEEEFKAIRLAHKEAVTKAETEKTRELNARHEEIVANLRCQLQVGHRQEIESLTSLVETVDFGQIETLQTENERAMEKITRVESERDEQRIAFEEKMATMQAELDRERSLRASVELTIAEIRGLISTNEAGL